MPYINQTTRDDLEPHIKKLIKYAYENHDLTDKDAPRIRLGVANYVITRLVLGIIKPKRYADYCDVIGTFESAKLECYRRLIAPYEDEAIEKNGDLDEYQKP